MKNKSKENVLRYQQRNADKCFALFLLVNCIVTFAVICGILLSVNGYRREIFNTYSSVTCCGSICLSCLFSFYTFCMLFSSTCVVVFFVGFGKAIYKALLVFVINRSLFHSLKLKNIKDYPNGEATLKKLPYKNYPIFISRNKILNAFTFGTFCPKICLSSHMFSYLTPKELQAVILHEFHHLCDRTPLKLVIMQIFSALNFFLPINNYLVRLYKTCSEKAADDAALQVMNEPLELASALLKLSGYNTQNMKQIAISSFSSEPGVLEDRIRRLIEPKSSSSHKGKLFVIPCYLSITSLFFAAIIFSSIFAHIYLLKDKGVCKESNCHMVECD